MSDVEYISNGFQYDADQLAQIQLGLKNGLLVEQVAIYARPEFDCDQMLEIRRGLMHELDVSVFADPSFSFEQMAQIRFGLEHGLSPEQVKTYARPDFHRAQMIERRTKMENCRCLSK